MKTYCAFYYLFSVDGGWSDWEQSSDCSVTCGDGVMQMTRTCTEPAPASGGIDCQGDSNRMEPCSLVDCPGN